MVKKQINQELELTSLEEVTKLKDKYFNSNIIIGDPSVDIKEIIRILHSHHHSLLNNKERIRKLEIKNGI